VSAHAVVENGGEFHEVLNGIEAVLKERFNIEHTTIQLRPKAVRARVRSRCRD
jgi:Co/Zn/Cd efflux system component